MRKLPAELAKRVTALFPEDELIAELVERCSLALPDVIRIKAAPTINEDEVIATLKAFDAYDFKSAFLLKNVLLAKAETLRADKAWGLSGLGAAQGYQLAVDCEDALKSQPLVAAA